VPIAQLLQSLFDGCLPWLTSSSGRSSTGELDPRLNRIQLDMKMRAYDLRAVQQELQLLYFEMSSYGTGMQEQVSDLTEAVATARRCQAEQLQQQHDCEESLQAAPSSQHYQLSCTLKTADMAASHAQGRVLLLQRQLSKALAQQAEAAKAFQKFTNSRNNKRAVAAAAAAAMAAEAADADADDGDSDAGVEEPVGMAANAQAAGGTQSGSSAHREPFIGPDLVLTGPRVWPWGQQVLQSTYAHAAIVFTVVVSVMPI